MLRTVNDSITVQAEKFSCGCDQFDKFVILNEQSIIRELTSERKILDFKKNGFHQLL